MARVYRMTTPTPAYVHTNGLALDVELVSSVYIVQIRTTSFPPDIIDILRRRS